MKKILTLLLTVALAASFCSCGAGGSKTVFNKGQDVFITEKVLERPAEKLNVYTPQTSERGVALSVARIFQGVINKTQPRVYLADDIITRGVNVSALNRSIIENYGKAEFVYAEMDQIRAHQKYSVFWSLWRDYSDEIENIYIFDLDDGLQDSMNVAAMLAGRNHGIAIPRDLYEDLYSEGDIGRREVVDVCEKYGFTTMTGSIGINRWICENMAAGANKELIFMIYPGNRDEGVESHPAIYDFAVAVNGLIYWVDPDFNTFLTLQKNILDQFGSNALVIGWPGINMERAYVASVSECGKDVVCADWGFANGSVVAGFEDYYPTECTSPISESETALNNKVYVAFTVSDGDAWHYATKELLAYWQNPARGAVPITWTIPSLFAKYHPALLHYLYDTKSGLDEFIQGPTGVGYIHPTKMPDNAYSDYLEKTASAFEKTKINMVNYWDYSSTYYTQNNARLVEYVNTVKPDAVFLGHDLTSAGYFMIGDTVCINEMGCDRIRGTQTADEIISNIDSAVAAAEESKPVFIAINVEAWGEGVSTIAEAYTKLLDREDYARYEFVLSSTLVSKIRSYEKNGANGDYSASDSHVNVITVTPNTEEENTYMYANNNSKINEAKGVRFADATASWIYKFMFDSPANFLKIKATLSEEFAVKISKDGETWVNAFVYSGSRAGETVYLADAIALLGETDTLYMQFEDAVKSNGFGCALTDLKLYWY